MFGHKELPSLFGSVVRKRRTDFFKHMPLQSHILYRLSGIYRLPGSLESLDDTFPVQTGGFLLSHDKKVYFL